MKKLSLEELGRLSPEAFQKTPKTPFTLVLDNIRSGLNVGSAFRTADAFAIERLILTGITVKPPHREVLKTAIGADATVAWEYKENIVSALEELKAGGYFLAGVEQTDQSQALQEFEIPPGKPLVLVFGNEVQGLSEEALPLLDAALEIPQFGTKHSLNVSVCLGIVVWELFRKWKDRQSG